MLCFIIINSLNCAINGKKYELEVYNTVNKCYLDKKPFNTQKITELGGCRFNNDIECNFYKSNDIPIEIKKLKTPDWTQCSLKFDYKNNKWIGSNKNKIPEKSKEIFENIISTTNLFNGLIPPFMFRKITYNDWVKIKKETNDYNDIYIDCPDDTIKRLYKKRGCYYIQISNKGLYHLGDDICGFNVPEFICRQQLRVRTKIHSKNKNGYCRLSVIASCQPKTITSLLPSPYSLDNKDKLPFVLKFNYK